ncbi:MAG: DUF4153 domain-containing protein [Sulfitobacter sp.]
MKSFTLHGVPMALQRDGWWLSAPPPPRRSPPPTAHKHRADGARLLALAALIALGDVLVWQVVPGLSLALFGALLIAAALWVTDRRLSGRHYALVTGGTLLALLPLVELVQPLSVVIAVAGVSLLLVFIAGLPAHEMLRGAARIWPVGLVRLVEDIEAAIGRAAAGEAKSAPLTSALLGWALPLGLGAVFAALLLLANPVAQGWLAQVQIDIADLDRVVLWLFFAVIIWPALSLPWMRERLRAPKIARSMPMGPARRGVINPASVTRALIGFNALFALQTAMDVTYLYGGAALPEGMSYAQYAHRGAYPLLLTAVLAGGFALLTRRWTQGAPLLRGLLLLWVAQNVALVLSSLVRLDLYVGVYGLTRLRLSAAIWMGLVAAGLALILWQVWARRDNAWLMRRGGALGACVLYLCSLVSFDAAIARYNLNAQVPHDAWYLCSLGEAAAPVIRAYEQQQGARLCPSGQTAVSPPQDWREWGFRNARTRNSLSAMTARP